MKRGEVYWVNFDPSVGEEIQKTRPAVIVSNNSFNERVEHFQVIPLSTRIERVYAGQAIIFVKDRRVKAVTNQIKTVSKKRMGAYFGVTLPSDMRKIEVALKVQLGLR